MMCLKYANHTNIIPYDFKIFNHHQLGKGFPAQVLESLCRPQEGTISSHGLGLTIVRQIAAAHGGTFTPKNTETGTLVTLTFPRAEEEN